MSEKQRKNKDYEIGKGRPPKDSRWKPGQSGNPNGRPPNPLSITALHKEYLAETCPEKIWKSLEQNFPGTFPKDWQPPTWAQYHVARNNLKAANVKSGDTMAKINWEMVDGKPGQQITGPNGGPIEIAETAMETDTYSDVVELYKRAIATGVLPQQALASIAPPGKNGHGPQ